MSPHDVCKCGDYRSQHEGGTGRCKLGSLCTPTPCTKFRLFKEGPPNPPEAEGAGR